MKNSNIYNYIYNKLSNNNFRFVTLNKNLTIKKGIHLNINPSIVELEELNLLTEIFYYSYKIGKFPFFNEILKNNNIEIIQLHIISLLSSSKKDPEFFDNFLFDLLNNKHKFIIDDYLVPKIINSIKNKHIKIKERADLITLVLSLAKTYIEADIDYKVFHELYNYKDLPILEEITSTQIQKKILVTKQPFLKISHDKLQLNKNYFDLFNFNEKKFKDLILLHNNIFTYDKINKKSLYKLNDKYNIEQIDLIIRNIFLESGNFNIVRISSELEKLIILNNISTFKKTNHKIKI